MDVRLDDFSALHWIMHHDPNKKVLLSFSMKETRLQQLHHVGIQQNLHLGKLAKPWLSGLAQTSLSSASFVSFSRCLSSQYLVKGSGHKKILNLIPFHPWICHPVSHGKTHGIPWCHHEFLATCCAWSFAAPGSVSFFPGSHSCRLSIFLNKSYQIPTSSCFCSLLWDSTLETSRNISYRSYQTIHAENTPCPKKSKKRLFKIQHYAPGSTLPLKPGQPPEPAPCLKPGETANLLWWIAEET